jgi:hypothetical protein
VRFYQFSWHRTSPEVWLVNAKHFQVVPSGANTAIRHTRPAWLFLGS